VIYVSPNGVSPATPNLTCSEAVPAPFLIVDSRSRST
jgi:hypothetical protein